MWNHLICNCTLLLAAKFSINWNGVTRSLKLHFVNHCHAQWRHSASRKWPTIEWKGLQTKVGTCVVNILFSRRNDNAICIYVQWMLCCMRCNCTICSGIIGVDANGAFVMENMVWIKCLSLLKRWFCFVN